MIPLQSHLVISKRMLLLSHLQIYIYIYIASCTIHVIIKYRTAMIYIYTYRSRIMLLHVHDITMHHGGVIFIGGHESCLHQTDFPKRLCNHQRVNGFNRRPLSSHARFPIPPSFTISNGLFILFSLLKSLARGGSVIRFFSRIERNGEYSYCIKIILNIT